MEGNKHILEFRLPYSDRADSSHLSMAVCSMHNRRVYSGGSIPLHRGCLTPWINESACEKLCNNMTLYNTDLADSLKALDTNANFKTLELSWDAAISTIPRIISTGKGKF